jgi:hypothetical protein
VEINEMKLVLQAIDDLDVKFAAHEAEYEKQKAEYEHKIEGLQTVLRRLGKEWIAEMEGKTPEQWPKGVAPVEGGPKESK